MKRCMTVVFIGCLLVGCDSKKNSGNATLSDWQLDIRAYDINIRVGEPCRPLTPN